MNPTRAAHLVAHWSGFGDKSRFPTVKPCEHCDGRGGHHNGSRDLGRLTPWGWDSCPECDGEGAHYSPDCRVVRRYTIHRLNAA